MNETERKLKNDRAKYKSELIRKRELEEDETRRSNQEFMERLSIRKNVVEDDILNQLVKHKVVKVYVNQILNISNDERIVHRQEVHLFFKEFAEQTGLKIINLNKQEARYFFELNWHEEEQFFENWRRDEIYIFSTEGDRNLLFAKRYINTWSVPLGIIISIVMILFGIGQFTEWLNPILTFVWTLGLSLGYLLIVGIYRLVVVDIFDSI
ncbi:hypothetical protein ESZ50_10185 [Weissella muntiaci]|uniref:Uncharacterized protein n=1 Tax=Weissella muntiaci TaxID=2508881 RepID=A0A6C2C2R5_9LACO|nr:hypothetical protein [Weissella muntiaci]TYC47989.1 hypothetical protein ESZ50_10185 [Weissella muntiaci]